MAIDEYVVVGSQSPVTFTFNQDGSPLDLRSATSISINIKHTTQNIVKRYSILGDDIPGTLGTLSIPNDTSGTIIFTPEITTWFAPGDYHIYVLATIGGTVYRCPEGQEQNVGWIKAKAEFDI